MISIVDYGMGNLGSIANMLRYIGKSCEITSDPEQLYKAEKLILPGVGAFDSAMQNICNSGLRDALDDVALRRKVPVLGICLGMQLLTKGSEEGVLPGLNWIDAHTLSFRGRVSNQYKVPHMGWNVVRAWQADSPLLKGLYNEDEVRFYFVHSYFVKATHKSDNLLSSEYGLTFDAAINRDNIFGVQFHPEKSHRFGMTLLKNFAEL